ncbi:MAG TPA: TRAP transporter small permease [Zeimonas sp.]|nr:TRAP transporter small permease [Zeimonas sp.]
MNAGIGRRLAEVFGRLEEGLVALLLALMTIITFIQVVARYVFNYSFVWALELTTFLFGGLIFLGISYGVRVGAHIGVDAVTKLLAPRTARIVAILATLLCLAYATIVFVGGWIYVDKMYEIGILAQDVPIPQWIPRLVMPVGYALLFIRFVEVLWRLLTGKEAHLVGDEVEDAMKLATGSDEPPPGGRT